MNETNETVTVEMEIVPVQNVTVPAMNETNETVPVEMEIVPVQNETVPAMNETNETIPVEMEIVPMQNVTVPAKNETNETVPAQNVTVPDNHIKAEPLISASHNRNGLQPQVMQLGSPANPVFVIGTGPKSGEATQIGGTCKAKTRPIKWALQPHPFGT